MIIIDDDDDDHDVVNANNDDDDDDDLMGRMLAMCPETANVATATLPAEQQPMLTLRSSKKPRQKKATAAPPPSQEHDEFTFRRHYTADRIHLRLNLPAISQHRYYKIYQNRPKITKEGEKFIDLVQRSRGLHKISGPISLTVHFSFRRKYDRDVDNLNKALLDAMKNVMFEDDSNIVHLNEYHLFNIGEDFIDIQIEKCDPTKFTVPSPPQEDRLI